MARPERVFGVDFSGSVEAGRKIWIAAGTFDGETLCVDDCVRGEALQNSGRDRETCVAALRSFIAQAGDSAFGLDFPLSLPHELFLNQTWLQFIRSFAVQFPTAEDFRADCLRIAHGRELKRATEIETKTPFSPYNLRLYRQTYFGLRDVIGPLVAARGARVLPLQSPLDHRPCLIEICPASTLKRLGLYVPYKGKTDQHRQARTLILSTLTARHTIRLSHAPRSVLLDDPEGDALDSVIALWATARAARTGFACPADRLTRREGWVFA